MFVSLYIVSQSQFDLNRNCLGQFRGIPWNQKLFFLSLKMILSESSMNNKVPVSFVCVCVCVFCVRVYEGGVILTRR